MPTVTDSSCIACRSAACVLGGVRLISSARMTLAKVLYGLLFVGVVPAALVWLVAAGVEHLSHRPWAARLVGAAGGLWAWWVAGRVMRRLGERE